MPVAEAVRTAARGAGVLLVAAAVHLVDPRWAYLADVAGVATAYAAAGAGLRVGARLRAAARR